MSESVTTAQIICPKCGKKGKWSPNIAGRKVKCRCGTAFVAPATIEAAAMATDKVAREAAAVEAKAEAAAKKQAAIDADEGGDMYELAPANMQTGFKNPATGEDTAKPSYTSIVPKKRYDEDEEFDATRDKTLPMLIIVAAFLLPTIFASTMMSGENAFSHIARGAFLKLGINVGVMLAGYFVAAKKFQTDFSPKRQPIVKVVTIAAAPLALFGFGCLVAGSANIKYVLNGFVDHGWNWFAIDAVLSLPVYFGLFAYFLKMQPKERYHTIVAMWAVRVFVADVLIRFLVG